MARLEKEARNASDQAQQRQSRDQLLGATLSGDDNQCKFSVRVNVMNLNFFRR